MSSRADGRVVGERVKGLASESGGRTCRGVDELGARAERVACGRDTSGERTGRVGFNYDYYGAAAMV